MSCRSKVTLPPALASRATRTGGRYRIEVPEQEFYPVLERLRGCRARILSVTQLKPTLEDFFLRLIGREQAATGASCRSGALGMLSWVVAVNTFREAVRDRVLYNLIFFALLMIAAAVLVGQISIGIERLVIVNLGLTAISVFGLMMAVFIGVGLVYKEIDKFTLYVLLSKPIRRWEFLLGKYAGLLLTLTVNTALMTLGLAAALFYVTRAFPCSDFHVLVAIYFIFLKLALVTALALLFSCFSTPLAVHFVHP